MKPAKKALSCGLAKCGALVAEVQKFAVATMMAP